jgi:hypothetical protein
MKMASKWEKNAPATLHSSDLLLGIHCICSQSRDAIPVIYTYIYEKYIYKLYLNNRIIVLVRVGVFSHMGVSLYI